jgi:signal transduction histidine kinase/Tfp pilus assembly protein PilF
MQRFIIILISVFLPVVVAAQNAAFIDSLTRVVQSEAHDSLKLKAYFSLAWQHLLKDSKHSREYLAKASEILEKSGDINTKIRLNHYWGLVHRVEGNYDSSIFFFQRVVSLNEEMGRPEKSLQALYNMGVVNSFKGFYDRSLERYIPALRIAEKVEDRYMIAEVLNSMGIIHKKLKNYTTALDMTYRALDMASSQKNLGQKANCLSNIGSLYAEMEQYDSALVYYRKTYEIDSILNMQWGIGHQLANIGRIHIQLGNLSQAEDYLNRSLEIREKLGQPREISESLVALAILKNQQERFGPAVALAERGLEIAGEIGDMSLRRDANQALAIAYSELGRHREAYEKLSRGASLSDSILNESTSEQINRLQIQYETEKKENEIALLTRDKEIQQAELEQKNTRIVALIVVFALLFIIAVLLIVSTRIRMKNQKLLSIQNEKIHKQEIQHLKQKQKLLAMDAMVSGQEEERKRIAKDLHDGLGNLLANVQMRFSMVKEHIEKDKLSSYHTAYDLLDNASGEVRKIAHNMMPGTLTRFGLVETLKDIKKLLAKSQNILVDVQVYGIKERLPERIEITLYRIVQELINNIIKHARANEVLIQLTKQEDELHLLVEDNGIGFDWNEANKKGGLGLGSLQSRIDYLDGSLEVDSSPGQGSCFMIGLSLNTEEKNPVK